MNHRFILAAVLAATGLVSPALAADLRMPQKAAPIVVSDWSGIYVGVEAGYGWGRQDGLNVPFALNPGAGAFPRSLPGGFDPFSEFQEFQNVLNLNRSAADVLLGRVKQNGWLAGGFFGAQKQWGNWVLGLEGDIDGANIKGSVAGSASRSGGVSGALGGDDDEFLNLHNAASLESRIDMLASVRGKVGFVPAPNWLIYGTGGLALAHVKNTLSSVQSLDYGDDPDDYDCGGYCVTLTRANSFALSGGTSMFGWAAGLGVDWKFPIDAGSSWVFGVEYLHYGFPSQTITMSGTFGNSLSLVPRRTSIPSRPA
jgi:outer membrane immunogenic protein